MWTAQSTAVGHQMVRSPWRRSIRLAAPRQNMEMDPLCHEFVADRLEVVESTSGGTSQSAMLTRNIQLDLIDHVTAACFVEPASIYLRFADGFGGTWTFSELELETEGLRPETLKPSASWTELEVMDAQGEVVYLDSSSIRYLVDRDYASQMDAQVAALMIPSERLERIAKKHQPPQQWYESEDEAD